MLMRSTAVPYAGHVVHARRTGADLSDSMRNGRRIDPSCACRCLQDESGFAVPTVLFMLMAVMAIVSVGVIASIQAQSGGVRDEQTKSAFAVAESGAQQAILAVNRKDPPCTATDGSWCAAPTESLNGATFQTWIRQSGGTGRDPVLDVVSQANTNGVTRRVHLTAEAVVHPFADYSVRAQDLVQVDANAHIDANTSSNGNIVLGGNNSSLCGSASVGDAGTISPPPPNGLYLDPASGCTQPGSTVDHQNLPLPEVDQGAAWDQNDNARLFPEDTLSGNSNNKPTACWNGVSIDGRTTCAARQLVIGSNSSVTLTGYTYSFCSLVLNSNSSLFVAGGTATAPHDVTIYFGTPDECRYTPYVSLDSNARISAASGTYSSLALLFVGPASVQLSSNSVVDGPCDQNLVIYGPETDVTFNSNVGNDHQNTRFCGAIGAQNIHLNQNSRVTTGTNAADFSLRTSTYTVDRFVECTAAGSVSSSDPTAGC